VVAVLSFLLSVNNQLAATFFLISFLHQSHQSRNTQVEEQRGTHRWRSFSSSTIMQLEDWSARFGTTNWPNRAAHRESLERLAEATGITIEQIRVWLANKRARRPSSTANEASAQLKQQRSSTNRVKSTRRTRKASSDDDYEK
jgi:hypothetical protein